MNRPKISFKVILRELRRRKVVHTCALYLLACWGVLQIADIVFPSMGFDMALVSRTMLVVAILGFPVAVILSWFYQISASGITRTPAFIERRTLDNIAPLDDRRKEAPLRGGPARDEAAYDWVLEIESGPLSGQCYGVESAVVVGRSRECDLTVPVARISRQHARFILEGKQLLIEDLGSSNGTAVNGARINTAIILNHRDTVEMLDVVIRIKENFAHSHTQDDTTRIGGQLKHMGPTQNN